MSAEALRILKPREQKIVCLRAEVHEARNWYTCCLLMGAGEKFALRRLKSAEGALLRAL